MIKRRPPSLRAVAWLALVAALLLTFAPSLSRLQIATHAVAAMQAQEACHEDMADHAQHGAPASSHHGSGTTSPWGDEGHCAYCPLASHLAFSTSFHLTVAPDVFGDAPVVAVRSIRLPAVTNLRGLGSQGPPLA